MSAVIAKTAMGFCSCGLQIEPGEQVLMRSSGAVHVSCSERTTAVTARTEAEPTWSLFSEPEQATIERAREVIGVNHISFDGPTALGVDVPRLASQLARVYSLMSDGRYRTLEQISSVVGCLETSASARLRDFRKPKFGGHSVVQRQVEGAPLLYEYRLIVNEKRETDERQRHAA